MPLLIASMLSYQPLEYLILTRWTTPLLRPQMEKPARSVTSSSRIPNTTFINKWPMAIWRNVRSVTKNVLGPDA